MASTEEVKMAMKLFHENRPKKAFDEIAKKEMGLFAVLKYLYDAEGEVNSKDINNALGISSARMAILLKKLESRNWIVKSNSKTDARAIVVTLSEEGMEVAKKHEAKVYKAMEKIVDEFGLEELKRLFTTLNKIKSIMDENLLNPKEE